MRLPETVAAIVFLTWIKIQLGHKFIARFCLFCVLKTDVPKVYTGPKVNFSPANESKKCCTELIYISILSELFIHSANKYL